MQSQQPGQSPPHSPNRAGGSAEESLKKVYQIADTVRDVETEILDEGRILQTGQVYGPSQSVVGHVQPGVQAPGVLDWGAVGRVSKTEEVTPNESMESVEQVDKKVRAPRKKSKVQLAVQKLKYLQAEVLKKNEEEARKKVEMKKTKIAASAKEKSLE